MATTYTVDDTGGGTHLTVAGALAVAVTGDTILLSDGQTYLEGDLVSPTNEPGLTWGRTPGKGSAPNLAGDGPPLIEAGGFTWAVQFERDWTVEGINVQNCASWAWKGNPGDAGGTLDASFKWIGAAFCGGIVGWGGNGCTIDLAVGVLCTGESSCVYFIGTTGNVARCVLLVRCEGAITVSSQNGIAEHCVVADSDAAAAGVMIFVALAGGIARNCIVHDPGIGADGIYVGTGGAYESCCVDLDDPLRTPYNGHAPGSPPSTCLETDPLFYDPTNYHLAASSPCLGTGSSESVNTTGSTADIGFDGFRFGGLFFVAGEGRFDMGCYARTSDSGAAMVRALIKGSHLLDLIASTPVWLPPAESAHRWKVGNLGEIKVARATIDATDGRILHLRTDVPLLEGVVYQAVFDANLVPHSTEPITFGSFLAAAGVDLFHANDDVVLYAPTGESVLAVDEGAWLVTGGRVSVPPLSAVDGVLVDFDAPVFDVDGDPGWRIGGDGSHRLVGGMATIEKVIWAHLLTREGEMKHDPTIGTRLRVKEPIPNLRDEERYLSAQLLAVPFVEAARVTLSKPSANSVTVTVEALTDLGPLRTARTVPRS